MDKKVYNKIKLQYIKEKDIIIFQQLRNGIMGQTMNLQGKGGRCLLYTSPSPRD